MSVSPVRIVHANRIVSPCLPAANISVAPTFTYVGGPQFQLYDIAHAEQHLFVMANQQQSIQRLVWVQFEGFLPDNDRSYHYPVTHTVELGGHSFIYDTSTVDIEREVAQRPGSDVAAAHAFLQGRGYQLTNIVHAQRFVHLIGMDKRHELMIIYGERSDDVGETPSTSALERARATFTVEFL